MPHHSKPTSSPVRSPTTRPIEYTKPRGVETYPSTLGSPARATRLNFHRPSSCPNSYWSDFVGCVKQFYAVAKAGQTNNRDVQKVYYDVTRSAARPMRRVSYVTVCQYRAAARRNMYTVVFNVWFITLTSCFKLTSFLRLDALALSVRATATCLAGWLGGCPSHSGIVSKRLNLSENFFDRLKAPSL